MSRPWLSIVGIGEDGLDGLSSPARTLISSAEILLGGERHFAMIPPGPQRRRPWPSPLSDLAEKVGLWRGRAVTVVATGDPFCYGIGTTLARLVPAAEMDVYPAPSAFALACARLAWPRESTETVTLHGRPPASLAARLYPGARILVLSHDGATAAIVARELCKRGLADAALSVFEHLGGARERRLDGRAGDWATPRTADLNTIAITLPADMDARRSLRTPGLPDEVFSHDGKLTKQVVRAATLAGLAPVPRQTLWDVGAGSGAIGIEWLRAAPGARAYAVERDAAQRRHIARNAEHLGTPELEVVDGVAPLALDDLPSPDAIFIGGGLDQPDLIARCKEKLRPGGRLVANAVTVEGEMVLGDAHRRWGGDLRRIAVAAAAPVGRYTGWRPAMPITQWLWSA